MPKLNPNYPTTAVLIWMWFVGPACMAIGIIGILVVGNAWKTGQTYSFGIILNDTAARVTESDSPVEYWSLLIFMSVTVVVSIGVGIFSPIRVTNDYIKKLARQKKAKTTHQS